MHRLTGVAFVVLAGCTTPEPVLIANPASQYCERLGGRLDMQRTPAGEEGICVLPDGTRIDEWTLYRRDHASSTGGS